MKLRLRELGKRQRRMGRLLLFSVSTNTGLYTPEADLIASFLLYATLNLLQSSHYPRSISPTLYYSLLRCSSCPTLSIQVHPVRKPRCVSNKDSIWSRYVRMLGQSLRSLIDSLRRYMVSRWGRAGLYTKYRYRAMNLSRPRSYRMQVKG
jgi:hypothetical protein